MNRRHRYLLLAAMLLIASAGAAARAPLQIRFGTIVPSDTLWHRTLAYIAQDWKRIVGPELVVKIYPDGRLGDETDMVRKARGGEIDGVGLSSVGLSRIDTGVACLQVPLMLQSYEELDYVRDRLAPELERRIGAKGFKVLHWADGGWVYAFSKRPARTPDDLRRTRLFTSAGDPVTEALYKDLGFRAIPLSAVDMIPMLQAGTIDAFAIVPLFAQVQNLFRLAPYMTNVKWTPLVGGTVITQKAWERLPEAHRGALLDAARGRGDQLRIEIRQQDQLAIQEMQKRGLNVVDVDAATLRLWQREAENAYPRLRGTYCPADIFDEVLRIRGEFRSRQLTGTSAALRPTGI